MDNIVIWLQAVIAVLVILMLMLGIVYWNERRARLNERRARLNEQRKNIFKSAQIALSAKQTLMNPSSSPHKNELQDPPDSQQEAQSLKSWCDSLKPAPGPRRQEFESNLRDAWVKVRSFVKLPKAGSDETGSKESGESRLQPVIDRGLKEWEHPTVPSSYHAALLMVFKALELVDMLSPVYRLFHEASIFSNTRRPDYIITNRKEAQATGTNSLIMIEVKRTRETDTGWTKAQAQIIGYVSSRLLQLVGDMAKTNAPASDLKKLFGVGVLTTVDKLQLFRIHLDVVSEKVYVVIWQSGFMPLIDLSSEQPTEGFEVLVSLCCADPDQLGDVQLIPERVEAPDGSEHTVIEHLGSGGFSDVFFVNIDDQPCAIKRTSHSDANKAANPKKEIDILLRLSSIAGHGVPSLLPKYIKTKAPRSIALASVGVPTIPWIDSQAASPATSDSTTARLNASHNVTASLLATLHKAHEQGISHSDVRPPNVMIDPKCEVVMLIDWGNSNERVRKQPDADFIRHCANDVIQAGLVGLFFSGSKLYPGLYLSWDDLYTKPDLYCQQCLAYSPLFQTWLNDLRALKNAVKPEAAALQLFYRPWWREAIDAEEKGGPARTLRQRLRG